MFKSIQKFPEGVKKVILWTIVILLGIVLFFLWANGFQKRMSGVDLGEMKQEINFPEIDSIFNELDQNE